MAVEPRKSDRSGRAVTRRALAAKVTAEPILRPDRLSNTIVESLRDDIESGRVRPGERLPTELELMRGFNVSRTVIREAISRLQSEGMVVARRGSGVYVCLPSETARSFRLGPADPEKMATIREIFELRMGVESEAAALAAVRGRQSDIASLGRALDRLAKPGRDFEAGVAADVDFHRRIATLSRNTQIVRFVDFLTAVLTEAIRAARENSSRQEGWSEIAYQEHVAIFDAIAKGKPDEARHAIRFHLTQAQNRLGLIQRRGGVHPQQAVGR
jgi:GntR family transcriptional regulator, transcriptional repressor for pyruvate dehydrogenase complex